MNIIVAGAWCSPGSRRSRRAARLPAPGVLSRCCMAPGVACVHGSRSPAPGAPVVGCVWRSRLSPACCKAPRCKTARRGRSWRGAHVCAYSPRVSLIPRCALPVLHGMARTPVAWRSPLSRRGTHTGACSCAPGSPVALTAWRVWLDYSRRSPGCKAATVHPLPGVARAHSLSRSPACSCAPRNRGVCSLPAPRSHACVWTAWLPVLPGGARLPPARALTLSRGALPSTHARAQGCNCSRYGVCSRGGRVTPGV